MGILIVVAIIVISIVFILLIADNRSEKERKNEAERTLRQGLSEAGMSEKEIDSLPWEQARK